MKLNLSVEAGPWQVLPHGDDPNVTDPSWYIVCGKTIIGAAPDEDWSNSIVAYHNDQMETRDREIKLLKIMMTEKQGG